MIYLDFFFFVLRVLKHVNHMKFDRESQELRASEADRSCVIHVIL